MGAVSVSLLPLIVGAALPPAWIIHAPEPDDMLGGIDQPGDRCSIWRCSSFKVS